jgi:hypothetical protein
MSCEIERAVQKVIVLEILCCSKFRSNSTLCNNMLGGFDVGHCGKWARWHQNVCLHHQSSIEEYLGPLVEHEQRKLRKEL